HNALPQSLKNVGNDLDEKFKQILQAQLARLDVVTREEFDVQSQVLLRTREKLTELEKRLDELTQRTDE
ncbi:TPA: accessory factor UbiK family protein, partial [Mannheimia haemolytica]|nr:accessory factor UbiK family protein [Mannheimia haemolytica]